MGQGRRMVRALERHLGRIQPNAVHLPGTKRDGLHPELDLDALPHDVVGVIGPGELHQGIDIGVVENESLGFALEIENVLRLRFPLWVAHALLADADHGADNRSAPKFLCTQVARLNVVIKRTHVLSLTPSLSFSFRLKTRTSLASFREQSR